jgi:ribosomal protein S18 acetylase RimI-like enzyme
MSLAITSISSTISPAIRQLYEQAFPEHERRIWTQQEVLVETRKLLLIEIKWDTTFVGFIFYWQLTNFVFIEHFAIVENTRGKGIGAAILKTFTDRFSAIILETEPPDTNADAMRRIQFYERAGFVLFDEVYLQPSYTKSGAYFPMRLMYRNKQVEISFEQVRREIYARVYGIK